jgi:hypothetical protein
VHSFDYAIVRVVPRVDRDEHINVGVVLYCRQADFLGARVELDRLRLRALFPSADADAIDRALAVIPLVAAGDPAGGPIARLDQAERFHWLVAPRSTIVQTSPVHSGLCDDPDKMLRHLLERMVRIL